MENNNAIMEALAESDYIHGIDPKSPGADFNNDPACFARYCAMQANDMERRGFLQIAKELRLITKTNA